MPKDRNTILHEISVVIKIGHRGLHVLLEAGLIFLIHIRNRHARSSLLVDQFSQSGLPLDKEERDSLSPAELGEPKDEFYGVDVVGNAYKFGGTSFDEVGDVVETESEIVVLSFIG